jgi:1-acyl-sn-glycerol-3-phosphate acyltransferase
MRLTGWRIEGNLPNLRKYLIIVAPHTSNWDFFYGFLAYLALRLDATWLAKHTIFQTPLGPIARRFGGSPIDRSQAGNVVQAHIREFAKRDHMALVITPEGTRKKVPEWKRGFYFIALGAGVPIVPVALDFFKKRILIGDVFAPTGDYAVDLPRIKSFYNSEMARNPAQF